MLDQNDQLLFVLSAKQTMAWSVFKRILDQLSMARSESVSRFRRSRTARILETLGHCDFDFGISSARVHVSAPVLARLPIPGLPVAVLAGARSPATPKDLDSACLAHGCTLTISSHDTDLCFIPPRLMVQGETEKALQSLALSMGIAYESRPSSWLIANFAGSLDNYLLACKSQTDGEINWTRSEFHPASVQFKSEKQVTDTVLIRYTNPRRGKVIHLLLRHGRYVEVDCDWGRYAVLREIGMNIMAYDERKKLLAVPVGTPLPRLFARSVGLCSGFAPYFMPKAQARWPSPEGNGFDIFRSVPASIAELIAEKVGQSLIPHPVKIAVS